MTLAACLSVTALHGGGSEQGLLGHLALLLTEGLCTRPPSATIRDGLAMGEPLAASQPLVIASIFTPLAPVLRFTLHLR